MGKTFATAFITAALLAPGAAALAAEHITQPRTIDARVAKVKLGGAVDLQIKQGPTASLVITGTREMLDKVKTTQNGDTLTIEMEKVMFHWGKNSALKAELTVPSLNEFTSTGVGSTEMNGFSGNDLKISLDGAGSINVNSQYKNVNARLGGVGSMNLNTGDANLIDLAMRGAGSLTITGNAKTLKATLGGVGSLDAKKLTADSVDLDLSGLGGASVYAKTSANLNLSGLGSATVYGKPINRNSNARGLGSVSFN
jgi:hypothetical protein